MNERQNISSVFFTTGDQFQMDDVPTFINDRGQLYATPDALVFSGRTLNLKIQDVKSVSLGQVNRKRAAFTLASAAILLVLGAFSLARGNWPLGLIFLFFVILALAQWRARWVRLQYLDENDHLNEVYIADSSYLGLGGLLGGTGRIYRALARQHKAQLLRK
jgi:hypothetical protein